MEDPKITIRFELNDGCGGRFTSESSFEVLDSIGESVFEAIGERFKTFMRQSGIVDNNREILITELSNAEMESVKYLLSIFRKANTKQSSKK